MVAPYLTSSKPECLPASNFHIAIPALVAGGLFFVLFMEVATVTFNNNSDSLVGDKLMRMAKSTQCFPIGYCGAITTLLCVFSTVASQISGQLFFIAVCNPRKGSQHKLVDWAAAKMTDRVIELTPYPFEFRLLESYRTLLADGRGTIIEAFEKCPFAISKRSPPSHRPAQG